MLGDASRLSPASAGLSHVSEQLGHGTWLCSVSLLPGGNPLPVPIPGVCCWNREESEACLQTWDAAGHRWLWSSPQEGVTCDAIWEVTLRTQHACKLWCLKKINKINVILF